MALAKRETQKRMMILPYTNKWTLEPDQTLGCLKEHAYYLQEKMLKFLYAKTKPNLTKRQKKAIRILIARNYIIIKPTDKSGGLVLLNKIYFEKEAFKEIHQRDEKLMKITMNFIENKLIEAGVLTPNQKGKLANTNA